MFLHFWITAVYPWIVIIQRVESAVYNIFDVGMTTLFAGDSSMNQRRSCEMDMWLIEEKNEGSSQTAYFVFLSKGLVATTAERCCRDARKSGQRCTP